MVTNKILAQYLGKCSYKIPMQYFNRNDYMKKYVNINKSGGQMEYTLTNKGKMAISLIHYFENFYNMTMFSKCEKQFN